MGDTSEKILWPVPEAGSQYNGLNPPVNSGRHLIYQQFQALKPGDHLCLLYETRDEWLQGIIPFILFGLEQNHKCLYISSNNPPPGEIERHLSDSGIDAPGRMAAGQFAILSQEQVYTPDNYFDPERTIKLLIEETQKALKEGYSALRATGEMDWALKGTLGSDKLSEYEARLNDFFAGYPCIAVCQYDLSGFEADTIKEVIKTHPLIIYKGKVLHNCYYIPPDEYLEGNRSTHEVRHWLENLKQQKARQLELQASEDRYQALFETSGTAMCLLDEEGTVRLVNHHWVKTIGYTREEAEGIMHFTRFIHPDDFERLKNYFYTRLKSPHDIPEEYETRVLDKAGNTRHAIFNVKMIPDSKDRIISALDITALKESEELLRQTGSRYKALFENAPVAISEEDHSEAKRVFDRLRSQGIRDFRQYFTRNPDKLYQCYKLTKGIGFNRALLDIFEVKNPKQAHDLVNSWFKDGTATDHGHADTIIKLAEGKTCFSKEEDIVTVKGNLKHISTNVVVAPGCEDSLAKVYISFTDITPLKESEGQYRALVDLSAEMGDNIIMLVDFNDQEGVIAVASEQFILLTGYNKHELLSKSFFDLLTPPDREAALSRHRRKMRGESIPGLFEVTVICKNGRQIPIELTSAVTQYRGKPANVTYLRDITERKRKEKILIDSERRLKALSNQMIVHQEAERVMLSRELHDQFGQALVYLRLEVLNLQRQYKELKSCTEIGEMLNNVDSLIEMTRNLASQLRPGMLDKLGLVSTLRWYADEFKQQTGVSCETVIKESDLHDTEISSDTAIVAYRIVQEALTNVTKHSQATKVKIILHVKRKTLIVSVEDNGIGVSRKKQADKLHLGLLGMQERASIVGGVLKTKNRFKKGFTVSAYLPLAKSLENLNTG